MAFDLFLTDMVCPIGPSRQVNFDTSGPELFGAYGAIKAQVGGYQARWFTLDPSRVGTTQSFVEASMPTYTVAIDGSYNPTLSYLWAFLMPIGVWCIQLKNTTTITFAVFESAEAKVVRSVKIGTNWTGRPSYWPPPTDHGPGQIGVNAVAGYIWRPGGGLVGMLWETPTIEDLSDQTSVLHNWNLITEGSSNSNYPFAYSFSNPNVSSFVVGDVTGIQDGDLLCIEYGAGRRVSLVGLNFYPWPHPAYPDSYVDGDTDYKHALSMPTGGSSMPVSAASYAAAGVINLFRVAGDPFEVTETGTPNRPVQNTVGF